MGPLPHSTTDLAVDLVRRFGWNTTSHQILNPGITHFFSAQRDAVTGYVDFGRVRVAAGLPICAPEALPAAMEEFEQAAARAGKRACYFYAEERGRTLVAGSPRYSVVQIGAQPVWQCPAWGATFDLRSSLRAQRQRARNKGIEAVEWSQARATRNPLLEKCLAEWLAARRMSELHFLVEPSTLGFLEGRRIFVAEKEGLPLGFLVASPIASRRGWLIEQVIRGRLAPNGTAELLIDAAVRAMAAAGDELVTLGLTALAQREERVQNPPWLRLLFSLARAHGRRFYNFDGLERFKAKFRPHQWEPVYMISQERRFSFGTLLAVAGVFTGGHLGSALVSTLRKAARQELRWLRSGEGGSTRRPASR